jgi:anti-anti-sigma factor
MKIVERRAHNYHVIDLSERLTIKDDLEQLEHLIQDLLERQERNIAIGLKDITYLDSTGSAMLIVCFNSARKAGVKLKFLNPSSHVAKIFEITKLDTIFDIMDEKELSTAAE